MTIEYKLGEDYIYSILKNGEEFLTEDDGENSINIPKKFLNNFPIEDLREDVVICPCSDIQEGMVILDNDVQYSIRKVEGNNLQIDFSEIGRRKYWDGEIGYKLYMETRREIIEERERELGDIKFEDYDDDGDYIHMNYTLNFETENVAIAIQYAEQIIEEIDGALELTLGKPFKLIAETDNEAQFTISILLPLLRKLGFSDVRYNHGKREYGKDIIFSRRTEFDEVEYWGVQVKYGDVSGGAKGDINTIISQAEDAFRMPFYDVYSREKKRISKLAITISGSFTENAVEKIVEGIERHSLKNNMVFIDGEKITTLSERFRKR